MKLYRDTPGRYERHVNKNRMKWFEKMFRKNRDDIKAIAISLSSILVYYCFSIILTFFNRYLFITYKFPLSITVIHLIIKYMISSLVRSISTACNSKQRITLDWMTYLKRIIPTGIASAADIGFSNWSLQYITITLYTMSKSTVILFIFLFSILFKLEKWRRSIILVVMCISSGLFLFTYHSTEFHLIGFTLVMIASFSAGLRWTLTQTVTQKKELGLSNPVDMIYHIQPGMILCLLPLAVFVEGLSIVSTEKFFRSDEFSDVILNISWILIGAFLAFFLESSEYLVVTYTSSLTLSISGIFKEICTIYLAVILNHNQLNLMNTIGLVVCLIGICIHVFVKAKQKAEEIHDHQRLAMDERHRIEGLLNESASEEETDFMPNKPHSSLSKGLNNHSFPLKKYLSKTSNTEIEAYGLLEQQE